MAAIVENSSLKNPADDLDKPIIGTKAIADEVGLPLRKAFYRLEAGHIPAEKFGRLWITTKRRLRTLGAGSAA